MANQFLTNRERIEMVAKPLSLPGGSGGWWLPAESAWLGTSPFLPPTANQGKDRCASVSPAPHRRHGPSVGSVTADSFERYY